MAKQHELGSDRQVYILKLDDLKVIQRELHKGASSLSEIAGYDKRNVLRVYRLDEKTGQRELIAEAENVLTFYYRATLLTNALFGAPINKTNVAQTELTTQDFITISQIPENAGMIQLELPEKTITLDYGANYGLRYVAIGCGGIASIDSGLLTTRPSAAFNQSEDPIANAKLYVPLHFGTPNPESPNTYERYITPVNPNTQEQYLLIDSIKPVAEQGFPIPLALKVTFTIPSYLANFEQQNWSRPDLQPYYNSNGITVINEFGFYYADIRRILQDAESVFMFSHIVYHASFIKTPDIAYTFEYQVYF